ncbi:hypothetical protein JCM11251_000061 [Rhodosporidiobolus azoricus]
MVLTPSYLDKVHLHPLTFALDALDKLDSLSLSLVQFHLDSDEEGFSPTLHEARNVWTARRKRATASGQRLEGAADTSSPSHPASNGVLDQVGETATAYPALFHPLVETLRYLHTQHERPLKSQVGLELKQRHPDLYSRDPQLNTFKLLAGTAAGRAVHEAIEEEFWKRRSASTDAGEEWEDPSSPIPDPTVPPRSPNLCGHLPHCLASEFHTVEVGNLPPATVSDFRVLISLLGSRLSPSAAILYRADQRNPPALSCRRAHIAYRSSGLAGAAQAHLTSLNLDENGVRYHVTASLLQSAHPQPRWEWGDVLEPARTDLWRSPGTVALADGKRLRDCLVQEADYSKRRKMSDDAPQHVSPSSLIPTSALSCLYGVAFSFKNTPPPAKQYNIVDDAFVHRFHAVAWREEPANSPSGSRYVLLFTSSRDVDKFQQWVEDIAVRFWKFNGTKVDEMSNREVQRLEWRYHDSSPSWRTEHNIALQLPPGDDRPIPPTVGQLGKGRNVAQDERVGWFLWEYTFLGLPQPLTGPGASLAARFGPVADEDSQWYRRDSRTEGDCSSSRAPSERAKSPHPSLTSALPPATRTPAQDHHSPFPPSSFYPDDPAIGLPHFTPLPSDLDSEIALAAPLPSVFSYPSAPALARQQQEEPRSLGPSALAIARTSPTLIFDGSKAGRSARSRRPTATALNDFEQDLDKLFAGAEGLLGTAKVQEEEEAQEEEDTIMEEPSVKEDEVEDSKPAAASDEPAMATDPPWEAEKSVLSPAPIQPSKEDLEHNPSTSDNNPVEQASSSSSIPVQATQPFSMSLTTPAHTTSEIAGESHASTAFSVARTDEKVVAADAPPSSSGDVATSASAVSTIAPVSKNTQEQLALAPFSGLPVQALPAPQSALSSSSLPDGVKSAPLAATGRSMPSTSSVVARRVTLPSNPTVQASTARRTSLSPAAPALFASPVASTLSSERQRQFPPTTASSALSTPTKSFAPALPNLLPIFPPAAAPACMTTTSRLPFALPARPAPGAPRPVDLDIPGGFPGGKRKS